MKNVRTNWFKRAQEYELEPDVRIERYGKYWGVYFNGDLLAVVLYLKGARSIETLIGELWANK